MLLLQWTTSDNGPEALTLVLRVGQSVDWASAFPFRFPAQKEFCTVRGSFAGFIAFGIILEDVKGQISKSLDDRSYILRYKGSSHGKTL